MARKEKLIFWGNCQAGYQYEILRLSPEITRRFELGSYLNFSQPGVFDPDVFPDEEVANCKVLVYHKVYSKENLGAAAEKLALLPPDCLRIPIPYLKSNLYWPFFNSVIQPMATSAAYPMGLLPYRSPILDAWVQRGFSDDSIIEAFNALDPAEHLNLDRFEKDTIQRWLELEKESEGKVKFAAFLIENWRSNMQFYIYNHVAKPILLHIANQILELLDAAQLNMRDIAQCPSGQDLAYPVHPGAARYYGIKFAKPGTRYKLGSKNYTFSEFIKFYLATARLELPKI